MVPHQTHPNYPTGYPPRPPYHQQQQVMTEMQSKLLEEA